MDFSGVNVVLISAGTLTIGVVGAIAAMSSRFVKKNECLTQHRYDHKAVENLAGLVGKIERNTDIQFRMLRAMVAHMEHLTPAERARILNADSGKQ